LLLKSKKIALWGAVVFVFVQACTKEAPPKQFVARVDQALLTEEELAGAHDSLAYVAQRRSEYIDDWVNAELLFQEAKRRGIDNNNGIRKQIEATAKKLIVGALLEQELYGEENVSEDEIVTLYNSGGDAFRLHEDVVNVSYALFGDRDAANAFRGKLVRGTAWNVAVQEAEKDSLLKSHLMQVAIRQFFTQSNLYPIELWKLARNLGKDEVSFAVKTDAGYYILVSHSVRKQGEVPEIEYARNEVRDRLIIERRRLRYERLLAGLRAKHSVEVRLAEGDTSSHTHE
jgi:peptidyl-prolyl cis-trans isomerase C